MKYYVVKYKYLHTTSVKGNLGDNIQSISAINMLNRLGIENKDIDYLNRDDLAIENSDKTEGIFVAQGWFGSMPGQKTFPINDKSIHPLYFGFHVNEGSWHILSKNEKFIKSMKKYEPIGCRDLGTRDFLRTLNVKAYYSRCLTMTFDKRIDSVEKEKVFIIDVYEDIEKYIPPKLLEKSVKLSQEDYSSSNYSPSGEWPMNDEDVKKVDKVAYGRLEIFRKEASLVITSRIHIAMPCASMGIPVVFCFPNKFDSRASVLQEILPIYDRKNFENIDWETKAPEMEEIKKEMLLIFAFRLQVEENKMGLRTKRLSDDDYKKAEKLVEHACLTNTDNIVFKPKLFSKEDVLFSAFGNYKEDVMKNNIPIVLFGAGSAGGHLCAILKYFGVSPSSFCDNNVKTDDELLCNDLPVITFNTLIKNYRNSFILITTKNYLEPIKKQLLENNFSENQIFEGTSLIEKYIDFAVLQDEPHR